MVHDGCRVSEDVVLDAHSKYRKISHEMVIIHESCHDPEEDVVLEAHKVVIVHAEGDVILGAYGKYGKMSYEMVIIR